MTRKQIRELIFNKYGGRCAYCGVKLEKGWHVDEIEPVRRLYHDEYDHDRKKYIRKIVGHRHPENLNVDNQNPACASCNINKHSDSLEEFRGLIEGFMYHLNNHSTQYKIAKRYGLVVETNKPVKFYFETFNKEGK